MLYDRVSQFITENSLIPRGGRVIAAVSGGADSVCMLDLLQKLREPLGFTLECAHFNHNLRGAESDADEEFVRKLCARMGIELHVGAADVKKLSVGRSVEDAARQARYAFFESLGGIIATAHTQNDNVETFFINLLRGSGGRGLSAIPVKRGNIIRPMLNSSRQMILEHLAAAGLEYKTDSSNFDSSYLRNYIRLELMPALCSRAELSPLVTVSRAIENICGEQEALDAVADTVSDFTVTSLKALPDALLWRVLTKKLEKEQGFVLDSVHFDAVKSLLDRAGKRVQLRGDIYAENSGGTLTFIRLVPRDNRTVKLMLGENTVLGKTVLIKKNTEVYNRLTNTVADYDKINSNLYAGSRADGDEFHCQGRKCSSRLKKLLVNDKLPRCARDSLVVIRDGGGRVVFVEGYGVDSRFCADSGSKKTLSIEII